MRTQTSYLLLGSFVISGLALLTASVVVLSAGVGERDVIKAETLFEESVSGLEVGAPCRFRGVTVGRVRQITVAGALYQETDFTYVVVRFDLWGPEGFPVGRLRESLPRRIAEGLRVRQASTGVTGISFLEADILPDADKYPPKPRDWMPNEERDQYLYIPSAPSALGEVVNTLEKALNEVVRADLPGLVQDIRAAVVGLQGEVKEIGLPQLREAVTAALTDVRRTTASAEGDVTRIANSIDSAAKSFSEAAAAVSRRVDDPQLTAIVADLKNATSSLASVVTAANATLGDAQSLLAGRAGEVAAILQNLERATAHLRALAATAEQYPSWLLFGTPPRGNGK